MNARLPIDLVRAGEKPQTKEVLISAGMYERGCRFQCRRRQQFLQSIRQENSENDREEQTWEVWLSVEKKSCA